MSDSKTEIAKSGAEVLRVQGLATASLVNPEREAVQWAELQMGRLKVARREEPIIVVGVGSGFHLRALQAKMTDLKLIGPVIAIDTCRASIDFTTDRLVGVDLLHVGSDVKLEEFFALSRLMTVMTQPFTLLKHKPTVSRVGGSLRGIEDWLLGRTPESFAAHLRLRPEVAAGLNAGRAAMIAQNRLVSIRDLSKIWDISSELKTDRRVFRVLEELVR